MQTISKAKSCCAVGEGVSKDSSSFLFFILSYLCRLLSGRDFSIAHDQLQYILPQTSQDKAFYAIKEGRQAF